MQWKCRGGPETIFIEECVRYRRGLSWSIILRRVPVILLFTENRKLNNIINHNIKKYGS